MRRARQVDSAFLSALSTEADSLSPNRNRKPATLTRPSKSLDRILFIGDCMWEHEQLFPEVRKICDLEVLDLHPRITPSSSSIHTVVSALQARAASGATPDPDLILFYARPSLLSEEAFTIIHKRWSCPLLGMNLDDRVEFFPYGIFRSGNDNYARWIHSFDVNLTSSLVAMDWYRSRGAEVRYFPQGFRPDARFLQPPATANYNYNLSFVGSWKPERGDLIDSLSKHGIRPSLFGSGWDTSQWADDPQSIFRGSQINLGIGYALASARIANAKGRDIECPAMGACYLTTYQWELAQVFEIGKEVLCYRNLEELVEMLTYFIKRPDACLAIARAAHKRAHAEHTWEIRLRHLFHNLGFNPVR